ncbi:regulator of chromosome condensation 1/beta-lactamase-inhibitor protein II [Dipodascopsis uninucleata]
MALVGLTDQLQAEKKQNNIGVYTWGYNEKHSIGPGYDQKIIRTPRLLSYFNGVALRDLAISDDVGAALNSKGDLFLWGDSYDEECKQPELVVSGKDFSNIKISNDRIYCLTKKGDAIYSIPVSKKEQAIHEQPASSRSWYSSMFNVLNNRINFKVLKVPLDRSETIKEIATGEYHMIILTSKGRVFTSITGKNGVNSTEGQLGIPILAPQDYHVGDTPLIDAEKVHEIATLRGINIVQIAAGRAHSIVRDSSGRVWSFGSNSHGQLGIDFTLENAFIPIPTFIPLDRLYKDKATDDVFCSLIAAGGDSTYFMTSVKSTGDIDVWVSGNGLSGQHGTGRFLHMQGTPRHIKSLSGINEYDEKIRGLRQIPLLYISVGQKHVAAVLDNAIPNNSNGQRELLIWGGNEYSQLGNGKRNSLARPSSLEAFIESGNASPFPQIKQVNDEQAVSFVEKQHLPLIKSSKGSSMEATIVCGGHNSAIYWKTV